MNMNINPVLLKELKVKMRGWRAAAIVSVYLAILAAVTVFLMIAASRDMYASIVDPNLTMNFYITLAIFQFAIIIFIIPALTTGAISGEREKQTLDLLLTTRLSTFSIIIGKLFASLSHILLLIVASLPIFSIIFMYGGISFFELIQLIGFYIVTAVMVGSIGIFFSTFFKKTTAANVMTYAVLAFMLVGTILLTLFYMEVILEKYDRNTVVQLMYINPATGFGSLIWEQIGRGEFDYLPGIYMKRNMSVLLKPWMVNIVFDLALSSLLIWLSAMKLNPIKRRKL